MHLADLLIQAERPKEALEHCTVLLARQPDHREALKLAAQAAEAAGDVTRAFSYKRLLDALNWSQTKNLLEGLGEPDLAQPEEAAPAGRSRSPEDEPEPIRLGGILNDDEDADAREMDLLMERPDLRLEDVAGMEDVKRRLNIAFLAPMRNPEMRKLYGKSLRGGLLLYGPPGCGKTFIARATAGELGARFLSIGLTDVIDMYLGESERKLHETFEAARRNSPCVLFFDEIDALGRKRSLRRESAGRDVVNQLLAEMDSVSQNNEGVFVLAATNHPWDVDTALRRPGRLDRTLLVVPPDQPARVAILEFHLKGRPVEGVDVKAIASQTDGFSGADLAHLCESAAENAMEESITSGRVRPIGPQDFKRPLREIRPSAKPWFETARNYALFANDGGAYDDLVAYLRGKKMM